MTSPKTTRVWVILAWLAVSLLWGSTYLAIRIAVGVFPPFLLSALRFIIGGGLFYVALRVMGHGAPTAKEWGSALVTGSLFFVVGNGFINVAEQTVSSGLVSVLVATMPLWATVFFRFTGQRASRLEWVGIGLGLLGVVVINLGSELRASGHGALFGLLGPVGWASASVLSKKLPLPAGPMSTAAQMIAGGVVVLVVSRAVGEPFDLTGSAHGWIAVAYLIVFGSIVGFTAYRYLLQHTRTAVATSYAYVNPVIAVALGAVFANERLDLTSVIGAAVVLTAVLLISRGKGEEASAVPPRQSLAFVATHR